MGSITHLRALLKKQFILWRRSWIFSILEILIPTIFSLLFYAFRAASPLENVAQTSYINSINNIPGTQIPAPVLKNCKRSQNGGMVALAPPGDSIVTKLGSIFTSYGMTVKYFNNNGEINNFVRTSLYASGPDYELCFAVVINKNNLNNEYSYDLRFNISGISGGEDIPSTLLGMKYDDVDLHYKKSLDEYVSSGYLQTQNWIDNIILQQELSQSSALIDVGVASVTIPEHEEDGILTVSKGMTTVLIGFPMMLAYLRLVNGIMREKEKKIKEGMKIMGLRASAFYLAWFLTYFVISLVTSIFVSLIFKGTVLKKSSWAIIFFVHFLYSLALMSLGILITVFFNKVKVANVLAFVIAFASAWPSSAVKQLKATTGALFGVSICPLTSVGYGFSHMFNLENLGLGETNDTVSMTIVNYKLSYHFIWTVIEFVGFLLLAAYLEQVLPSEFGVQKHPLFCLRRSKKHSVNDTDDSPQDSANLENIEPVDPTLKNQDHHFESIKVQNLRMKYDNGKLAVDGVAYNMYIGQIFALLGHNGAGKTTTINMITGMYKPSSGTVKVFEKDISTELDQIRQSLGVCPQHDVLFDNLTVQEHLELYTVFKGVKPKDCEDEINQMLSDLELLEQRDRVVKDLSGGQRRKLSVAIAFVGGSKFILLDEPSSGLDTAARRKLWDMLKNSKHGRVILLTTHYMDEADFLGDRIAIMGEGKIKCLGSSMFLKQKFGVGYILTVNKENNHDPSEPIVKVIQNVIPESKMTFNVGSEIKLQLPTNTAPKFKELFEQIDQNLKNLKISSYGVSVTTLEEVFLKIAETTAADNKVQVSAEVAPEKDFILSKERIQGSWANFKTQFAALVKKRYHYIKRDKKALLVELLVPVLLIIIGVALSIDPIGTADPVPLTDNYYSEINNVLYNTILPSNAPVDQNLLNLFPTSNYKLIPVAQNTLSAFDTAVFAKRSSDPYPKVNIFFNKIDNTAHTYSYTLLIDTRAYEASPFGINRVNEAILKFATGNNNKKIESRIYPFPNTLGVKAISDVLSGLGISFAFSIGMSFIPASIVTYITKERETQVKHQQIISGMSISAYWLSNLLVEYIKYLVPCIICPLIAYGMGADSITQDEKYGALWLLFILYGFSTSTFTYLTSFLFGDAGAAQTATFFINFTGGFVGGMAVSILRIISTSTMGVAKGLQWPLRLIPTFSLTYGFQNLSNRDIYAITEKYYTPKSAWDIDIAGGDILGLGVSFILYFILIFVVEYQKTRKAFFNRVPKVPEISHEVDGDVEREVARLENSNEKLAIKVQQVRKIYGGKKPKMAVDNVSFGLQSGEVLGLLGANGAGKTTIFKMLTGEVVPTKGKIVIQGYQVPSQLNQARQHIGYCPQSDAILENLTAREHLELFCALKGVPHKLREALIVKQLKDLNLAKFEHVCAGTYSGGNKRKLQVAIALLGSPPIIFLDEPSNGMDPEARRFMWEIISKISTQSSDPSHSSSVILTTHSMEEAEALSTKIAIQVDGNLRCLGSVQHIKARYGGGFEIEVKLEYPTKDTISKMVEEANFKGPLKTFDETKAYLEKVGMGELFAEVKEHGSGGAMWADLKKEGINGKQLVEWVLMEKVGKKMFERVRQEFKDVAIMEHFQSFYRIRINSDVRIGKVFGFFEDKKDELNITQYNVMQTSIEQIFNAFVNNSIPVKTLAIEEGGKGKLVDVKVL